MGPLTDRPLTSRAGGMANRAYAGTGQSAALGKLIELLLVG